MKPEDLRRLKPVDISRRYAPSCGKCGVSITEHPDEQVYRIHNEPVHEGGYFSALGDEVERHPTGALKRLSLQKI